MSSKVHGECRTFAVDPTVNYPKGIRVMADANGVLQIADATADIGTVERTVTANTGQSSASVLLRSRGCTRRFVASGAIAAFANFQAATDGKIATGGSDGMVLQAATADGDLVEALYY